MKFKYNFCETKLYKLVDKYTYEVSEDNHFHTHQGTYGSDGWLLGENERIIFTFSYSDLKVYYQKQDLLYKKVLAIPDYGEITFEFTESDRINSS